MKVLFLVAWVGVLSTGCVTGAAPGDSRKLQASKDRVQRELAIDNGAQGKEDAELQEKWNSTRVSELGSGYRLLGTKDELRSVLENKCYGKSANSCKVFEDFSPESGMGVVNYTAIERYRDFSIWWFGSDWVDKKDEYNAEGLITGRSHSGPERICFGSNMSRLGCRYVFWKPGSVVFAKEANYMTNLEISKGLSLSLFENYTRPTKEQYAGWKKIQENKQQARKQQAIERQVLAEEERVALKEREERERKRELARQEEKRQFAVQQQMAWDKQNAQNQRLIDQIAGQRQSTNPISPTPTRNSSYTRVRPATGSTTTSRSGTTKRERVYHGHDGAAKCIKFRDGTAYNTCSRAVHGSFCSVSKNKRCSCSKTRESIRRIGNSDSAQVVQNFACSMFLQPNSRSAGYSRETEGEIKYGACFKAYTAQENGGMWINADNSGGFKFGCGWSWVK